ncbi:MAG: SUF system NifU family Fe-S cluster assembly protein [Alphaproteobacteria bacterium]|jgi:nitrogen fixation NifU-like protein|nr:SUF system NifU family Fe-S cluster assembly protein [Alphaproteobacteria bacterium]|tara:strand:- start:403 stop:870 length:468 start_codon:yes stop_codon:yes gene_type:complete
MFDDLRDLYQEVILDHGKDPRNFRKPDEANREALGQNPLCGDQLVVYLELDDHGVIQDAAFVGKGCAISVASASMMTELIQGKTEAEADALFGRFRGMCTSDEEPDFADAGDEDMERLQVLSGVRQFPVRVKCATLAWHAMNAALRGEAQVSTEE